MVPLAEKKGESCVERDCASWGTPLGRLFSVRPAPGPSPMTETILRRDGRLGDGAQRERYAVSLASRLPARLRGVTVIEDKIPWPASRPAPGRPARRRRSRGWKPSWKDQAERDLHRFGEPRRRPRRPVRVAGRAPPTT